MVESPDIESWHSKIDDDAIQLSHPIVRRHFIPTVLAFVVVFG